MSLCIICLPEVEESEDEEIESSIDGDEEDGGVIESDIKESGGESDVCSSYERHVSTSAVILLFVCCC